MSPLQTAASSSGVPSSLHFWPIGYTFGGPHYSFTFDHSLGRLTELTKPCISDHRFIVKVTNQNQPKGETQRARLGAWAGGGKQEASRSSPRGFRRLYPPKHINARHTQSMVNQESPPSPPASLSSPKVRLSSGLRPQPTNGNTGLSGVAGAS